MENKPVHYDGSLNNYIENSEMMEEPFLLTDEARKNISGNPYFIENTK